MRWKVYACGCALGCHVLSLHGVGQSAPPLSSWTAAVAARQSFEAEPREEHTHPEFVQVMDNFRTIYHSNPADPHAARAVEQVAELLAEQGRELNDAKSLRAAAGQYEYLAKAYPGNALAGPALAHALDLLGPEAADDAPEAARVRAQMQQQGLRPTVAAPAVAPEKMSTGEATKTHDPAPTATTATSQHTPAIVTGIRHWSTASYTRVAIDLGGEVQFRAARVEDPDRIFFDLHGAQLSPGLVGKTFAVTDDGFLKTIRAASSGSDVIRVVLDVQPVAEYSAFLLPNPYRLIIDIHGKPASGAKMEAKTDAPHEESSGSSRAAVPAKMPEAPPPAVARLPAPVVRSAAAPPAEGSAEASSLPPMPVTDGSASFGLPPKRNEPVGAARATGPVARPRVVVSAKPTTAKPVPNTTASATPESTREIAAVSDAPGMIAATTQPTSHPVADRSPSVADRDAKPGAHRGKTAAVPGVEDNASPTPAPPPTAGGQSTLMRALGLKIGRIVIDAGHGGHDSGTLGAGGIEEKDVVLDVALRLGKLLHDRLGAEVVYTRADDTFVPLETRTAIANKAQADLFVSVHANSSADPSARGVEVYYLNFTSDPEAMAVAGRENAVSSQRVTQLSDLVKKIALKDKIDESRELAADVDQSLYAGLKRGNAGLKDRGVKKAPFVVLIGANMPSILAEISFVTNPDDAAQLDRPEYRERVAESLYGGIARYAGGINGSPNGAKPKVRQTERAER